MYFEVSSRAHQPQLERALTAAGIYSTVGTTKIIRWRLIGRGLVVRYSRTVGTIRKLVRYSMCVGCGTLANLNVRRNL
jgi:hypothetical protein